MPLSASSFAGGAGSPTVEESGGIRGYDVRKLVKGRKRHLLVDTLGLPIAWYVTSAYMHDTVGARRLLGGLAYFVPRLKKLWADAAYRGKKLADWCREQGEAGNSKSWSANPVRTASQCYRVGG